MEDYEKQRRGAGGTPGGIIEFFIGVMMIVAGGYMFMSRVVITSNGFGFRIPYGNRASDFLELNSFGLALLPLMVGIGFLFFNYKNILGWFLTIAGLVIIFFGILINLDFYFRPTNLYETIIILGLIGGGFGLVLRGLRPH